MDEIWCEACGDQVTPHNPGICGTCFAMKYRDNKPRLTSEQQFALKMLLDDVGEDYPNCNVILRELLTDV